MERIDVESDDGSNGGSHGLELEPMSRAEALAMRGSGWEADLDQLRGGYSRRLPAPPSSLVKTGHELDGWRVEEYGRSRGGLPLRVFLPAGEGPIAGLLTAAQHGEEAHTVLLARRLLERVSAAQTRWAVIPCLNPDGLLAGTRQNAAGVDLNRNFPAQAWQGEPTFSYPPGIAPERRVAANRTNRSLPGVHAASEPETKAVIALVERLRPPLVVDLHSPLELIFVQGDVPPELVEALASSAGLPVKDEMSACPGAFDDWLAESGVPTILYEVEHAGLPALCARHLPGIEAMLRAARRPR